MIGSPRGICFTVYLGLLAGLASAQEPVTTDLLELIDPAKHTVRGRWDRTDAGIRATSPDGAICVVPFEVTGDFELRCQFTRNEGDDVVGLILPLETTQVFLELSGWNGETHGLSRVNRSSTRSEENPTSVRPGTLENGRRYELAVTVRRDEKDLSIDASLGGKPLVEWRGEYADLEPNIAYNIPNRRRPAIAAGSQTVFHSLSLRHQSELGKVVQVNLPAMRGDENNATDSFDVTLLSSAKQTKLPADGSVIDLTNVAFQDGKGKLDIEQFGGEQVVHLQGQDSTVALLPGVELGDGVIEVEIASDIFSGVAFRAADVDNYDLVYFRPQNSGTAKHANTVQYVCKGTDGADWRTLRESFPGKYESGAVLSKNEWFRVRLVLRGESVAVYVDDADEPVLTVDPVLGERSRGGIGLWGWNTRFRNLSFQPM